MKEAFKNYGSHTELITSNVVWLIKCYYFTKNTATALLQFVQI
jgi:hypothetical protein